MENGKKEGKISSIFSAALRYSYPYVILALVIFIVLNLAVVFTMHALKERHEVSNIKNTRLFQESLENAIFTRKNLIENLLLDEENLLNLQGISQPVQQRDHYRIWKANYAMSRRFRRQENANTAIYFNNNDLVMVENKTYFTMETLYDSLFTLNQRTYQEFLQLMQNKSGFFKLLSFEDSLWFGVEKEGILLVNVKTNKYFPHNSVALILLEKHLIDQLIDDALGKRHQVSIYGSQGELLYANHSGELANTRGYLITETNSSFGFTCKTSVPKRNIHPEIYQMYGVIIIMDILLLMLALVYVGHTSLKSIRKIRPLLEALPTTEERYRVDLFDQIYQVYSDVFNKKASLESVVETQALVVKMAWVDKVLSGEYHDISEIREDLETLGYVLQTENFCVTLIEFDTEEYIAQSFADIEAFFQSIAVVYQQSDTVVGIIFGFGEQEKEQCERFLVADLENLFDILIHQWQIDFTCYCSDIFSNLREGQSNYEKCRLVMTQSQNIPHENNIIWCSESQSFLRNQALRRGILDYIKENFADPNLSLQTMAGDFDFSASYFSTIIKELTGETFTSLLDNERMKSADQLVCTTSLRIEDIAAQSGYHSANTFLRAYKRGFGVTPSERRILHQKEEGEEVSSKDSQDNSPVGKAI